MPRRRRQAGCQLHRRTLAFKQSKASGVIVFACMLFHVIRVVRTQKLNEGFMLALLTVIMASVRDQRREPPQNCTLRRAWARPRRRGLRAAARERRREGVKTAHRLSQNSLVKTLLAKPLLKVPRRAWHRRRHRSGQRQWKRVPMLTSHGRTGGPKPEVATLRGQPPLPSVGRGRIKRRRRPCPCPCRRPWRPCGLSCAPRATIFPASARPPSPPEPETPKPQSQALPSHHAPSR